MKRSSATTAAATMVLALIGACSGPDPDASMQAARQALERRDRAAAVVELRNVLQRRPADAEARRLLGEQWLAMGDAQAAEIEFGKALDAGAAPAAVVPMLARAQWNRGRVDALIDRWGQTHLSQPVAEAELRTVLAAAYRARGDTARADAALAAALQAVPGHPPALLQRARFEAADGRSDAALALLDELTPRMAASPEPWRLRGDIVLARGDAPRAADAYREAIARDADDLLARAGLVAALLAARDVAHAADELAPLERRRPQHPQVLQLRAELALLRGDVEAARATARQLVEREPTSPPALLLAGAVELAGGRAGAAEPTLARLLELAPELVPARLLLAQAQLDGERAADALRTLAPLLAAAEPSAPVLRLAGQAHLLAGDVAAANADFERLSKLEPEQLGHRAALELSRFAAGRSDPAATLAARQSLQALAERDPSGLADLALYGAELQRRDWRAAGAALDRLEARAPGRAYVEHLRGHLWLLEQRPQEAQRAFAAALARDPRFVPATLMLAQLATADGRFDAAIAELDRALALAPAQPALLMARAGLAVRVGAGVDEVAKRLDEAAHAQPTSAAPRLALVDFLLARNEPARALAAAHAAAGALPADPAVLDALGRAQRASGELAQATTSYTRLATLAPASPLGPLRLAELAAADGRNAEAEAQLRRALERSPQSLPAQQLLARVLLAAQRPAEAIAVARDVQRQRAKEAAGWLLEGEVEEARARWGRAVEVYRAGLERTQASALAVRLHHALLQQSPAEAERFATGRLRDHPGDAEFRLYLAQRSLAAGHHDEAERHYAVLRSQVPENATVLNNLAWLHLRLGRADAVELARRADALAPNTPAILDTLAAALAAERRYDEAVRAQQRAVELSGDAELRLALARLYATSGAPARARVELEALAALGERFPRQSEVAALQRELGR